MYVWGPIPEVFVGKHYKCLVVLGKAVVVSCKALIRSGGGGGDGVGLENGYEGVMGLGVLVQYWCRINQI